jgi:hypothetical protein
MAFFHVAHVENRRPWSAKEVALLGTDSDAAVARKLNRPTGAVALKRRRKGIKIKPVKRRWTPHEISLLGTMSDAEVARQLNRTPNSVLSKRTDSQIPAGCYRRWTPDEDMLLGTLCDEDVARQLGRELLGVRMRRIRLHIPVWKGTTPIRTG